MLELVFTVCMIADPTECEDHSLLYADLSQRQCIHAAQTVLAPWIGQHPGWRIDSYRCQDVKTRITAL